MSWGTFKSIVLLSFLGGVYKHIVCFINRTVSDSSRSVNTVSAEHPYDEVKDKSSYSQMDIRPTNAYLSLKPTLEKLV